MPVKFIKGNLITMAKNKEFDVIVHGCNCFHTMGAGIAKQIAKEFPYAFEADKRDGACGDLCKLGTYSVGYQSGEPIVVNAYTQFKLGPNFNRDAFRTILWKISMWNGPLKIGFPMIGAGLGKGDPDKIISDFIEYGNRASTEWTVVEYEN